MAARLHFVVEGQTEETFVNQTPAPHLAHISIVSDARCVATSRKDNVKHRGGVNSYEHVKNDIVRWTLGDRNPDARFTTMLDLYALPANFPGHEAASLLLDPRRRVNALGRVDIGARAAMTGSANLWIPAFAGMTGWKNRRRQRENRPFEANVNTP